MFDSINKKTLQWTLTHNDHKNLYMSAKEYIEENPYILSCFVSNEQKQLVIDRDEIWELQYYPDTPIGSVSVYAAEFEALLEYIKNEF